MVDIHCHILPGADDGAENTEEALQMLWKSVRAGVETIVATPHILSGAYDTNFSERQRLTAELQNIADSNGINIQIKQGVEYYLSPEMLEDTSKLKEFTINNNGKYVLVELPLQTFPPFVEEVFSRLKDQGITPVLAHPERNMRICQTPDILFELVSQGCLAQLNVGSLMGSFGGQVRKTAQVLLTHNLVHVVASDMHSPNSPTLAHGLPLVEKLLGHEQVSRMFSENPRKIVEGQVLDEKKPEKIEPAPSGLKGIFFRRRR